MKKTKTKTKQRNKRKKKARPKEPRCIVRPWPAESKGCISLRSHPGCVLPSIFKKRIKIQIGNIFNFGKHDGKCA